MCSCGVTGIGPGGIALIFSVDRNGSLWDGAVGPTEAVSYVWSDHTLTILTSMRWECEGSRKASDAVFPLKMQHLPQLPQLLPVLHPHLEGDRPSMVAGPLWWGTRQNGFSLHPPAHPPRSAIDSATRRNVWSFSSFLRQRLCTVLKIEDNSPLLHW